MKRIIAKIDIKSGYVIKGIEFEGVRKVGKPIEFALDYYKKNIDEIIYLDCVASLYNRNHIVDLLPEVAKNIFIPLTAGGGIRSINDAKVLFDNGADKIVINTAAVENPKIITDIAKLYGSQAVVLQLDCKKGLDGWEVLTDYGREKTELNAFNWATEACSMGAGEILATVIDNDGKKKGLDIDFYKKLESHVKVPIIASGGIGSVNNIVELFKETSIDAVSISSIFHYSEMSPKKLKHQLSSKGYSIRD